MLRILPAVAGAALLAVPAAAQKAPDRARVEWITGFLRQGSMADAAFAYDFSAFGGASDGRDQGTLSVDPSIWYGIRGVYRWNDNLSFSASWMHSRGRFRAQFPARASLEGDFDLEGLLMAALDQQSNFLGFSRPERAMADAVTDIYLLSASYEFPSLNRWFFPYVTVGGGLFDIRSDGNVFQFEYEEELPSIWQYVEEVQQTSPEAGFGVSVFDIDETDFLLSYGGGFRVSLSKRWGVDVMVEDLVRLGVDMAELDDVGTPAPDAATFRLFSTSFNGTKGSIHNFGVRASLNYALWPYGAPR